MRGPTTTRTIQRTAAALAACAATAWQTSPALAHASDRGHVLLLPTGHYIAGAALAVAASFLVLALLPPERLTSFWRKRLPLGSIPDLRLPVSLVSFAFFATLTAAGITGSRDPLSNPLPLTVWTLLWVGLTLAQGLLGNLWAWLNPWYGPYRLAWKALGAKEDSPLRLPEWVGYFPAFALFLAFAWFELIDPAPDDPARLAIAAGTYWLFSFAAMLIFGFERWSRQGEFLSAFFAMISRFGIFEGKQDGPRLRLALCWPGAKLNEAEALPPSGALFLLATLASVSFDGFSKTFFWLGLNGINPLELPGRTALVATNSLGLAVMLFLLAAVGLLAVLVGERLVRSKQPLRQSAGLFVWSIVPIALAYHFSHYLTAFLVNGQYALVALSDPFARGWNLLGTAHMPVEAGIAMGAHSAWMLWNLQAAAIVGGHVLAVLVAHLLAWRLHPSAARASLSQLPLTLLMIGYTVFGLWLLSTATAG
ncbi:hypothetical protein ACFFTN_02155 [Aminobacter aganoensis]|uniref:Fenitrothion hydrolase n=1 Tax=Aminobacter aganoensis TaxID=83264 RepID=A0A7X0F637_9HYPH|nr:hypothetical protein [Aminobacter aganoensis]MBB6353784.1 hypothetical protein [Aminobacter aganoensis]